MASDNRRLFIRLYGFISIWVVYVVSAITYGLFALSNQVNILYPFIALIALGITFTLIQSLLGLYSSLTSSPKGPMLYFDLSLFVISIVGLTFSILALPALNYTIELSPFNFFVASSSVIGIIIWGVGLAILTMLAGFKKASLSVLKERIHQAL